MKLTLTPIKDLVVIEPKVFEDQRTYTNQRFSSY